MHGHTGQNTNDITLLLIHGQSEKHFKLEVPPDHTSGANQRVGAQMCPCQPLSGSAFQKAFLAAYYFSSNFKYPQRRATAFKSALCVTLKDVVKLNDPLLYLQQAGNK